jgi:hypothetical protein
MRVSCDPDRYLVAQASRRLIPLPKQPDGPLATWLDGVLVSTGLLGEMSNDRREYQGEGAWTAGSVQYIPPAGGDVNATVQRTPRRLDDTVFTYGGKCEIELLGSGRDWPVHSCIRAWHH